MKHPGQGGGDRDPDKKMQQLAQCAVDYSQAFHKLAYRTVRNNIAVQDVVQEAYLKAVRSIDHFDGTTAQMHTWMKKIVQNCAFDYWRFNRTRPLPLMRGDVSGESLIDLVEDNRDQELSVTDDTIRNVHLVLNNIHTDYSAPLRLQYLEGKGREEIADALGIQEWTVASRGFRARKAFREKYEELGLTVGCN